MISIPENTKKNLDILFPTDQWVPERLEIWSLNNSAVTEVPSHSQDQGFWREEFEVVVTLDSAQERHTKQLASCLYLSGGEVSVSGDTYAALFAGPHVASCLATCTATHYRVVTRNGVTFMAGRLGSDAVLSTTDLNKGDEITYTNVLFRWRLEAAC